MKKYRVLYSSRLQQYIVQRQRSFFWFKWWKTETKMECGYDSVEYTPLHFSTEEDARRWIQEQAPINWRYIPFEEEIPKKGKVFIEGLTKD